MKGGNAVKEGRILLTTRGNECIYLISWRVNPEKGTKTGSQKGWDQI